MKKSLVALAVLGTFAGAASAQSSVTIYGLLNVAVTKQNSGTATVTQTTSGPAGNAYRVQEFGTSRLGFRGTEDLGGGLSAQFQFEHRFQPDTGAQSNAASFWNGRSFVQVSSAGIGSFYMGRDYTPPFWIQLKTDPFANDGIAQAGAGAIYANYLTPDQVGNGARTSNSIGFNSASFGGLTFKGAVGLSEASQQGRIMSVNAEYAAGPIYAGAAYEMVRKGTNDGLGLINVGASYDFGFMKAMGYYARSETRRANTQRSEIRNDAFSIGATAPVGPGLLKAMFYKVRPNKNNIDVTLNSNRERNKLGLGYDYPLSKRTNLYAEAVYGKEDQRTNKKAAAFGVKHLF